MIDFDAIAGFQWDDGNARKNERHGVSQGEAEQAFFDTRLLIMEGTQHSLREPRYHALGMTREGRHLHITFTLRDGATLIRVIAARDMHRKERAIHEQAV
ncbi:MAG TPA: BrnT family toxin [Casimicrobiaceae bacterium]|nr:BrnT family toxin [Casimicrobiaceae bacterium]